jgi:hypothetical protein
LEQLTKESSNDRILCESRLKALEEHLKVLFSALELTHNADITQVANAHVEEANVKIAELSEAYKHEQEMVKLEREKRYTACSVNKFVITVSRSKMLERQIAALQDTLGNLQNGATVAHLVEQDVSDKQLALERHADPTVYDPLCNNTLVS